MILLKLIFQKLKEVDWSHWRPRIMVIYHVSFMVAIIGGLWMENTTVALIGYGGVLGCVIYIDRKIKQEIENHEAFETLKNLGEDDTITVEYWHLGQNELGKDTKLGF